MVAGQGTEVCLGTVGKGPGDRTETNRQKQMSANNEKTKFLSFQPGLKVIKFFTCSTELNMKIKLLTNINPKAPNTTIAEFANTADPDETAHNEPSHLDLQCLPSSF